MKHIFKLLEMLQPYKTYCIIIDYQIWSKIQKRKTIQKTYKFKSQLFGPENAFFFQLLLFAEFIELIFYMKNDAVVRHRLSKFCNDSLKQLSKCHCFQCLIVVKCQFQATKHDIFQSLLTPDLGCDFQPNKMAFLCVQFQQISKIVLIDFKF